MNQSFQQRIEEVLENNADQIDMGHFQDATKALTQLFADEMKGVAANIEEETLSSWGGDGNYDAGVHAGLEIALRYIRSRYLI